MNKKIALTAVVSIFATLLISVPTTAVLAEQSGDTPESGVTSYIKQIYDSLVTLTYGSDGAGGWGDWGSMWNRIRSAAEWTPDGTATEDDVASGKTFYSDSRTAVTGTAPAALDYSLQALSEYDDCEGEACAENQGEAEDYQGEESVWTNTLPLNLDSEEVWQDSRTGLYWSQEVGYMSNIFPDQDHSSCPFFDGVTDAEKLAARYGYDGSDTDCGDAINACGALELDADNDGIDETNWYLPTQKELMQAYMDGMVNQTGIDFTTWDMFWSSSEVSYDPNDAWRVSLYRGLVYYVTKTHAYTAVRCVSRD